MVAVLVAAPVLVFDKSRLLVYALSRLGSRADAARSPDPRYGRFDDSVSESEAVSGRFLRQVSVCTIVPGADLLMLIVRAFS